MDVLFNDTAKVSTESEAQAPQADSYSTTTRLTVSLQNGIRGKGIDAGHGRDPRGYGGEEYPLHLPDRDMGIPV